MEKTVVIRLSKISETLASIFWESQIYPISVKFKKRFKILGFNEDKVFRYILKINTLLNLLASELKRVYKKQILFSFQKNYTYLAYTLNLVFSIKTFSENLDKILELKDKKPYNILLPSKFLIGDFCKINTKSNEIFFNLSKMPKLESTIKKFGFL